jgi:rod shape-determining protein MreD
MSYITLAMVGALLLLLDVTVAGLLTIGSTLIKPSLTLPFIVYIGLQLGPITGTLVGAAVGLGLDVLSSGPLGSTVFAYAIVGFFSGKLWSEGSFRLLWPWGAFLLISALFSESVAYYLYSRGSGMEFFPLFWQSGAPAAIYTTLLGLLWFLSPLHRTR